MADLISRQALLESIERISVKGNVLDDDWIYRFIQEFPSAQTVDKDINVPINDIISRQAAIKAIENLQDCYNGFSDTYDKACIIGVLEEIPTAQPNTPTDTPTDLISRQAAIDNLLSINEVVPKNKLIDKNDAVKMLVRLPSAQPERCEDCRNFNKARLLIPQPERKKGKWIKMSDTDGIYWACSECGEDLPRVPHYNPQFDLFPRLKSIKKTKFCPNCGFRMEEQE